MTELDHARGRGGIGEAKARFGGLDWPGTIAGMLTALATVTILGGLITAAIGAIGYQTGIDGIEEELGIGGLLGGLATLFLAFLFGGWAAARIARYDGKRNGLMTAVWALLLGALLAALGAWLGSEYNVFERVDLPNLFTSDAATATAIGSGVASALAMLLGGLLGGILGERWHRKADLTVADQRHATPVATAPAVDATRTTTDVTTASPGSTPTRTVGGSGRIVDATPDGSVRTADDGRRSPVR
jgi:hypothetical protein